MKRCTMEPRQKKETSDSYFLTHAHLRHSPTEGDKPQNWSGWAWFHSTKWSMYRRDSSDSFIGKAGAYTLHTGVLAWPVEVPTGQCLGCLALPVWSFVSPSLKVYMSPHIHVYLHDLTSPSLRPRPYVWYSLALRQASLLLSNWALSLLPFTSILLPFLPLRLV